MIYVTALIILMQWCVEYISIPADAQIAFVAGNRFDNINERPIYRRPQFNNNYFSFIYIPLGSQANPGNDA